MYGSNWPGCGGEAVNLLAEYRPLTSNIGGLPAEIET